MSKKRRERREEQCLSNTEPVTSALVGYMKERRREREKEGGREVFWVFPFFSVGHAR